LRARRLFVVHVEELEDTATVAALVILELRHDEMLGGATVSP
jgi:hypothetical protein